MNVQNADAPVIAEAILAIAVLAEHKSKWPVRIAKKKIFLMIGGDFLRDG